MSQAKGLFRILCLRRSSFSCFESMHRGKSEQKWSFPQGVKILCPSSSIYPCRFPAIFSDRFPESDTETTSFCLTAFDGGKSINLCNHIFNSFMLSASMASCSNEFHNLIIDCVKKYFLLFVLDLLTISWCACVVRNIGYSSPFTSSCHVWSIFYVFYIPLWFSPLLSKGSTSI